MLVSSVHKDVKPSNLLVKISPSGHVCLKVSDFDQSKELDAHRASGTNTTGGGGTRGWMAPELLAVIYQGSIDSLVCLVHFTE